MLQWAVASLIVHLVYSTTVLHDGDHFNCPKFKKFSDLANACMPKVP